MPDFSLQKSLEELKLTVRYDDPINRARETEITGAVSEQLKAQGLDLRLKPEEIRYIGRLWRVLAPYFERRG